MKSFSSNIRMEASKTLEPNSDRRFRYGFVGNIANNLYGRAVALRQAKLDISTFLHPHDTYVMSQPGWEEFEGVLPDGVFDCTDLTSNAIALPTVPDVYQQETLRDWSNLRMADLPDFVRPMDFLRWPEYFSYLPTLKALQNMDAALAVQTPYLAYLAKRPYLVSQVGGDIWYECSRDDGLGRLQRQAFFSANAFIVSNPWSFAFARRYGMRHLVYLPMLIAEDVYSPGEACFRGEWQTKSGGSFFVLSTSRIDDSYKGSNIGLEGFAKFSQQYPKARLIVLNWGVDLDKHRERLTAFGIADKIIVLPVSGKKRVIKLLRSADCLLDQFVLGYFGATALEAMACGVPVIMRLERRQYDALCDAGAPPVLDAETPDQVCNALTSLARDPVYKRQSSHAHRQWFLANHGSGRWAEAYTRMLMATALHRSFDFKNSPLAAPLSREEREYHAQELNNAPPFPNYH